jgi:hypothetical protein
MPKLRSRGRNSSGMTNPTAKPSKPNKALEIWSLPRSFSFSEISGSNAEYTNPMMVKQLSYSSMAMSIHQNTARSGMPPGTIHTSRKVRARKGAVKRM